MIIFLPSAVWVSGKFPFNGVVFNRKCKLFLGNHWWKLRRPFRTRCWQLSVDKWLEYVCIISIFIFIHLCCYVPLIEVSCMKSKISGEASDKVCYKGLWYLRGFVYKSLHTFCSWTAIEKDTTIYRGSPRGKKDIWINLIFSDMNEISHL